MKASKYLSILLLLLSSNAFANPNPNTSGDSLSSAYEVITNALEIFVANFSSAIANEIAPLVYGGLVLSFIAVGIMSIKGMLDKPFLEIATKMMKSSIIVSIALTTTGFQTYILDVFLTLPDSIISSVLPSALPNTNVEVGSGAIVAIEKLWELGVYNAGEYYAIADLSMFGNFDPLPLLYALLVLVGTLLCCVVGALWLFIAKILLAVMLAIAPIFIVCLIWQPTQQYFWSWLGMVLNTIITAVLVAAVFALFSNVFNGQLEALVVSKETANLAEAASFTFLGIVCMGVLVTIPAFVSQLTGASSGSVSGGMASVVKGGATGGASFASGTMNARRNLMATPSASKGYTNARSQGASRSSAVGSGRHEFNRKKQELKQGYPDYYRKQRTPNQQATPKPVQGTGGYGGGKVQSVNFNKGSTGHNFQPKTK